MEINKDIFQVTQSGNELKLLLKSNIAANEFGRMDFYSRLLHSLKPDGLRIWREAERLDIEIKGWPKRIKWQRTSEKEFKGKIIGAGFNLIKYANELERALQRTLNGETSTNGSRVNILEIGKGTEWKKY